MKKIGLMIAVCIMNLAMMAQEKAWTKAKTAEFTFSYPLDWKLDTSGQMGTKFIAFSPKDSEFDLFNENINLIVQPYVNDSTIDSYFNLTLRQLKQYFTNFNLISSKRMKKVGKEVLFIEYTFKQGEMDIHTIQNLIIKDDQCYVLTFTSHPMEIKNYRDLGLKMMDLFILN